LKNLKKYCQSGKKRKKKKKRKVLLSAAKGEFAGRERKKGITGRKAFVGQRGKGSLGRPVGFRRGGGLYIPEKYPP